MRMGRVVCCVLVALFPVLMENRASGEDSWQAGVATKVITPPQFMWMSGYASRDKPAQGKIHDLYAKALMLQDPSGKACVIVTLDLVGIDRKTSQTICEKIQQALEVNRSQVALATSHTHSGPVVGTNLLAMYSLDEANQKLVQDYTTFLIDSVVAVARDSKANLAPAILKSGESQATFAVNRRNNREADVPMLREQGQLVGPVDHDVPVLSVQTSDGKLKAVLFGYACHATVLSGMEWCGDWPGFAQVELEKNHPGTVALFWAGCGADQNPLPRRTVELAQEYGRQAAAAVDRALASPMTPVKGSLKTVYQEIDLALDALPTKEQVENDLKSSDVYIARRARWLMKKIADDGKLSPTYPYPVQTWAIGDATTLTFLGGEVVVDFAVRLRAELPGAHNWVAGYSNDVMAYIPSRRVLMEGGYEGASAMIYYGLPTIWSTVVEEHIVRTVHEIRKQIDGK